MSEVKFGLPLDKPVAQTILPIMIDYTGMCYGLYIIPRTTFTGTETSFPLTGGNVPLKSVTRPKNVDFGDGYFGGFYQPLKDGSEQFMAAVWDYTEERKEPWRGWPEWIGPNDTGYYHWIQMPTECWITRKGRGFLIESLAVRLDIVNSTATANPLPNPPDVQNGKFVWQSSVDWDSLQEDCSFFDLNWYDIFQAKQQRDPTCPAVVQPVPLRIVVKEIPPTGEFKVQVLTGYGGQTVVGVNAPIYNTLRFLKMKPIPNSSLPKDFQFKFTVYDDHNQSTDVDFTLTVTK